MENKPSRRPQFSMRSLLIAIAVSAVVILSISKIYRNYLYRSNRVAAIRLLIQPTVAGTNAVWVDNAAMHKLLMKDPEFQKLTVNRKIKNAKAWLNRRVVVDERTIITKGEAIITVALYVGEELSAAEIDTLLQSVTRVVQSEGAQSNMKVQVLGKTVFK